MIATYSILERSKDFQIVLALNCTLNHALIDKFLSKATLYHKRTLIDELQFLNFFIVVHSLEKQQYISRWNPRSWGECLDFAPLQFTWRSRLVG